MSRKHYPVEYREQIVKLARAGRSIASLAQEFEPTEPTIRSWLAAANNTVLTEEVELRRELRQVKRKIVKLEEEKAILAKAEAWFAKETDETPDRFSSS